MMKKRNESHNDKNSGKKIVDEYESNNSFDDEEREKIYRDFAMLVCSSDADPAMLVCASYFKPNRFLSFINTLNPSIKLDHTIMRGYCLKIYEEEQAKVQQILGSFDGQVCLSVDVLRNPEEYDTCDGSSNLNRNHCYMCVRVHFIDENWKLRNYVLGFDYLGFVKPKDIILNCFRSFDIVSKISVFMVHDTFDHVIVEDEGLKIIDILDRKIQGKEAPRMNGQIFRAPCCASLFCVMAEEAFGKIENIINKMRELDGFNKIFPYWHHKLENIVSILEEKAEGVYDSDEYRSCYELPSKKEWKRASDVCKLVGSIKKAAEVFYEAKNASASLYLYNIQKLRAALTKVSVSSDQFMGKMALSMLEKLNAYWKDAFMLLAFATVLDPRCKLKYMEFVLQKYEGDAGHSQFQLVHDAFHNLYGEYMTRYPIADFLEVHSDTDLDEEHDSDAEEEYNHFAEKEKKMHDNPAFGFDCLDEYNHFIQSNMQPHKSELELYLEEPVVPWNRNISLLSYWRTASSKYPTLGRMAKDILAIPLSLSTNYEAYYTDFRPADTGLICLKPNLRNALMCTRSWIDPKHAGTE